MEANFNFMSAKYHRCAPDDPLHSWPIAAPSLDPVGIANASQSNDVLGYNIKMEQVKIVFTWFLYCFYSLLIQIAAKLPLSIAKAINLNEATLGAQCQHIILAKATLCKTNRSYRFIFQLQRASRLPTI